jgi:hypothetical protein
MRNSRSGFGVAVFCFSILRNFVAHVATHSQEVSATLYFLPKLYVAFAAYYRLLPFYYPEPPPLQLVGAGFLVQDGYLCPPLLLH